MRSALSTFMCRHSISTTSISSASEKLLFIIAELSPAVRDSDTPIGLTNEGKVCYANCVLQCLFHMGPFRKAMYTHALSLTNRLSKPCKDNRSVLACLQTLFSQMALSPKVSLSPADLLRCFNLDLNKEDNAFHFFTLLCQQLNSCFELSVTKKPYLDSLFCGLRRQSQCCLRCHRVFYTPEAFSFLRCTITKETRLEEALQTLFAKRSLAPDSFLCPSSLSVLPLIPSCNTHCNGELLTTLAELPRILTVRLARTNIDHRIQIPLSIDLLPICSVVCGVMRE